MPSKTLLIFQLTVNITQKGKALKCLVMLLLLAVALPSCSKDEPVDSNEPTEDIITADFDEDFAIELQKRGYVADATYITEADVCDIAALDVSGTWESPGHLTSLKGIDYFRSLQALSCGYNQLTGLIVEKPHAAD